MCATSARCAPAAAGWGCTVLRRASTSRTSRRPSARSDSDAVTCESIGAARWGAAASALCM
eukprot:5858557-Prymnesium_polylepis.1